MIIAQVCVMGMGGWQSGRVCGVDRRYTFYIFYKYHYKTDFFIFDPEVV